MPAVWRPPQDRRGAGSLEPSLIHHLVRIHHLVGKVLSAMMHDEDANLTHPRDQYAPQLTFDPPGERAAEAPAAQPPGALVLAAPANLLQRPAAACLLANKLLRGATDSA